MATKHFSGVVSAAKVRAFIRSMAHEVWFYPDEEITGKAIVRDGYAHATFNLGDVELQVKVKQLSNSIVL